MIHKINIIFHVCAGSMALLFGLLALLAPKHTPSHVKFGRIFLGLLVIVVSTGFLGWLFFRSNNFLLMLTVLSGYVGYAGWRTIKLKEKKTSLIDVFISVLAISLGILFLWKFNNSGPEWNPLVIYSSLGALLLVTAYDLFKHFWLHPYIKKWWIYEHIYKMVSAFSAIFSAFIGTVLPNFQPYSQLLPSSFCLLLIIFLILKRALKLENQVPRINHNDKKNLFIVMALTAMTFSPIGEELFFRGIVHSSFAKSIGEVKASFVDSSAFALTHISHFGLVFINNKWNFFLIPTIIWVLGMFLMSILFFLFRKYSGSILGAIICHSALNLGMIYSIFYLM